MYMAAVNSSDEHHPGIELALTFIYFVDLALDTNAHLQR